MKFLSLLLPALLLSCSTASKKESQPAEYYFNRALKYKKSGSVDLALENLSQIRRNFFDSPYNQKALLLTGDIYFDNDKPKLALQSYKKYQRFYPDSQKEYVLYQMALCYKEQLPSWAENDLSPADSALSILQDLLNSQKDIQGKSLEKSQANSKANSPASFYKKALKLQEELINKKAKKDLQVILFYKNQKQYLASFQRVKAWIQDYPKSSYQPKALLTAFQLATKLDKDPEPFKQKLLKNHPQSKELGQLTKASLFQNLKDRVFL